MHCNWPIYFVPTKNLEPSCRRQITFSFELSSSFRLLNSASIFRHFSSDSMLIRVERLKSKNEFEVQNFQALQSFSPRLFYATFRRVRRATFAVRFRPTWFAALVSILWWLCRDLPCATTAKRSVTVTYRQFGSTNLKFFRRLRLLLSGATVDGRDDNFRLRFRVEIALLSFSFDQWQFTEQLCWAILGN